MPLDIRPATEDDLAFLTEAEAAVFSDAWHESGIRAQLLSETGYTRLLLSDGVPAGYLFGNLLPPEGELFRIAVLPRLRGRGMGHTLLSLFHRDAAAHGVTELYLEVREGNTAARALYEKMGYTLTATRKHYYRTPTEDACIYRCTLAKEKDTLC